MNNKGFTLIEMLLSIVLITAILYGLSVVPMELIQLKRVINQEYDLDLSVLKLKQTIDTEIMDGGIIIIGTNNEINELKIGKTSYPLNRLTDGLSRSANEYSFKIKGVKENIIYSTSLDDEDVSFFHLESTPEKQLRYGNKFTSFDVKSIKSNGGVPR